MIFGMCRYIFVGFHMELVLKCAKNIFFFLKMRLTGKKSPLIQIFFFFFCFFFSFKEAYYHVRVKNKKKMCEAASF